MQEWIWVQIPSLSSLTAWTGQATSTRTPTKQWQAQGGRDQLECPCRGPTDARHLEVHSLPLVILGRPQPHFFYSLWEGPSQKLLPEGVLPALWEGAQKGVTMPIMVLPPPSHSSTGAPESVGLLDAITATFHAVQSRNACPCHGLSPDVIFPEERCVAAHKPHRQTLRFLNSAC